MANRISSLPKVRKNKPTFIFILLVAVSLIHLYAASIQCEWTGIEKIVAVGDLHGDYKNFVKILKGTKLIDRDLHWKGGKTHLVQIGDVMDRGPEARNILDLLMRLEKEAEAVGGKVHMLIGNHEEMNITGISFDYEGYVTVEQFVSFLPDKYKEKKEKDFMKKKQKKSGSSSTSDYSLRDYWKEIRDEARKNSNHPARKQYIYNFNQSYGKWILNQNAVIRINDIIFVHAGISEEFSSWKLSAINDRARMELDAFRHSVIYSVPLRLANRRIVYEPRGPFWYRGLAQRSEEDLKEVVDKTLQNLGAKYMVMAHTPRIIYNMDDMSRFDGRIWIIDTGISAAYGGHLSALIIENGEFDVWPPELRNKQTSSAENMERIQTMIWKNNTWISENCLIDIKKLTLENMFTSKGGLL